MINCDNCQKETELKNAFPYGEGFWCNDCIEKLHEKQTLEQEYKKYIQDFREKHIPKRYNQIKMLDELTNPDIDHYMSISNRTDGKTFNYIHALLNTAIKFDLGLLFLSRNMMLRTSYQELLNEIIDASPLFERKDFSFVRNQYYIALNYNSKTIAVISDLNSATELKYFSSFIKKFPLIIYDEFIALETDYLTDEWERLKTIYESVDRVAERALIHKPKLFYFGNAVNFDSPILHGLKMFNILEKHPINTARIYQGEFNFMLEMHRNENANVQRNIRAFSSATDSMTTGEFESNDHHIATDSERYAVKRNPRTIYVKLRNDFMKIWFNPTNMLVILAIESRIDVPYQYNMQLKDNKLDSIYLKDAYYDEDHIKKIDRGAYLFDNNYSRNVIAGDTHELATLKIHKMIREFLRDDSEAVETESKEKQFQDNYIEETKRGIMAKIWG